MGDENIEKETFFKNFYSKDEVNRPGFQGLNCCSISELKALSWERPFEGDEIKKGVQDCCRDKSPAPDGSPWQCIRIVGIF